MQPDGDFEYLAARWYQIQTVTKEMQKLKAGFLLREILQQFTDKIQLNTTQQLWMYFAHDVTVANMMNTLGFFDVILPIQHLLELITKINCRICILAAIFASLCIVYVFRTISNEGKWNFIRKDFLETKT